MGKYRVVGYRGGYVDKWGRDGVCRREGEGHVGKRGGGSRKIKDKLGIKEGEVKGK